MEIVARQFGILLLMVVVYWFLDEMPLNKKEKQAKRAERERLHHAYEAAMIRGDVWAADEYRYQLRNVR